jgi:hypothetical protein
VYLPLVLLFAVAGLQASTIVLTATSTDGCGGNACSGTATINIIDANDFTITLDNTLTSIMDAGQLLTDFEFSLDGTVTMTGSNGSFINIASDGSVTSAGSGSTGWGFGVDSVTGDWLLCIICGNGVSADGSQPSQGIVPTQSDYASANPSIDGNSPHNPFLDSGAVFTFTTTATLPTDGTNPFGSGFLSFGTTFGNEIPTGGGGGGGGGGGAGGEAPEPFSLMLSGAGLVAVSLLAKRRQGGKAKA